MFSSAPRSSLRVLSLLLPLLLFQGCLASIRYRSRPWVQTGIHADIVNFSDAWIEPSEIDKLYLEVARLMNVAPDRSKPRLQVSIVRPGQIHLEYLRYRPSAKVQNEVAIALYIPHEGKILIPHFDRTLLAHELAHYFAFQYISAPRSRWEAIAGYHLW